MKTDRQFSAAQLDALLEVCNIGSGHAATVLSKMSDSPIMISTPELYATRLSEVGEQSRDGDEPLVATAAQILGDLAGHIVFVITESRASLLCEMLLQGQPGSHSIHDDAAQSCLKELGNILASSFMNALAGFLGMVLFPSVPTLTIDPPTALAEGLGLGAGSHLALYIRTSFRVVSGFDGDDTDQKAEDLSGVILFLPTEASLEGIFTAINVC